MKYQKLHKFNAKQEKGNFFWPENDHEHSRNRAAINANDEKESSNNSQKVRSLVKAMHRVLSSGEKPQQQSPRTPNYSPTKNSGFNQPEEDFEKFKNGSHQKANAQ